MGSLILVGRLVCVMAVAVAVAVALAVAVAVARGRSGLVAWHSEHLAEISRHSRPCFVQHKDTLFTGQQPRDSEVHTTCIVLTSRLQTSCTAT